MCVSVFVHACAFAGWVVDTSAVTDESQESSRSGSRNAKSTPGKDRRGHGRTEGMGCCVSYALVVTASPSLSCEYRYFLVGLRYRENGTDLGNCWDL